MSPHPHKHNMLYFSPLTLILRYKKKLDKAGYDYGPEEKGSYACCPEDGAPITFVTAIFQLLPLRDSTTSWSTEKQGPWSVLPLPHGTHSLPVLFSAPRMTIITQSMEFIGSQLALQHNITGSCNVRLPRCSQIPPVPEFQQQVSRLEASARPALQTYQDATDSASRFKIEETNQHFCECTGYHAD